MSSEGFKNVPGVPEGWELMRIDFVTEGEWYLFKGRVDRWESKHVSDCDFPIIRKIEKPKTYRPFTNAEEFKPHRDRWVTRIDKNDTAACPGACRIVAYDDQGILWDRWSQTWQDAFDAGRCFDDDGTPFGVEVGGE